MGVSLYWLQCGGCGGDTMSFLNVESPDITQRFKELDISLLHHPSLSIDSPAQQADCLQRIENGEQPLDILIIEGAVMRGPNGTGLYDTRGKRPKMDIIAALAARARYVVALGTCASFGGFGDDDTQATGLQFLRSQRGGFLGADFLSGAGSPVINLSGCPCHPDILAGTLSALVDGLPLDLDQYQRPTAWYGMLVHQGCTRNEYHEYRIEESTFGERGCLFFHLGCHGPLASGPCNKLLWNRRSSKTRAGVPCFGCTSPEFPQSSPFFSTPNIEGTPLYLPNGINRAHYMVYKVMAAAAAPERLRKRQNEV